MLLLAPQGFRVVAKTQPPEVLTSKKGNQYLRVTLVPYLTKSDAPNNELTLWVRATVFADTLPVLDHNDFVIASGKLELSKGQTYEEDGKFYSSLVTNDLRLATKDEVRNLMGFGLEKTTYDNKPEQGSSNRSPVADLETVDTDAIPF
jgi:hypothetical protein